MNQSILLKVYRAVFCILLFSIPYSDIAASLPNIILMVLIVLFPFCFRKETLKEFRSQTFYVYLILVLFITLNLLRLGNFGSEISQLGKLYLPILLFILSTPLKKYFRVLKISFMIGVFFAVCISLTSIAVFISEQGAFSFTSGKDVNEVLILERVYIAFLCVVSFVFSLDLLKYYKKYILINISILILFVLLIAARMALISIALIMVFYMLKTLDKRRIFYVLGLGSLIVTIFFLTNKNLQNRFFYKDHQNSFIENLKIWEPRMVIWPCVYDITEKEDFSVFNGLGSYKTGRQELVDCYDRSIEHTEKKKWFLFIKYNTHNQFLDFLMVSGLVGFLLFSLVFVVSFYNKRHSLLSISLILSFLLLGFVENFLHRQVGVYCFGILMIFLRCNDCIILNKKCNE